MTIVYNICCADFRIYLLKHDIHLLKYKLEFNASLRTESHTIQVVKDTALLSVTPVIKLHTLPHAWFHHSTIIYRCRQVHEGARKYNRSSSSVLGCQNADIKAILVTILSTQVAYRLQGLY